MTRALWIPVFMVAIAVTYAAVGTSPSSWRLAGPAFAGEAMPGDAVDDGRVHLDAAQISEARASGTWPQDLTSVLQIGGPLEFGEFVWNEEGVLPGRITVRV